MSVAGSKNVPTLGFGRQFEIGGNFAMGGVRWMQMEARILSGRWEC